MQDSGFWVPPEQLARLVVYYTTAGVPGMLTPVPFVYTHTDFSRVCACVLACCGWDSVRMHASIYVVSFPSPNSHTSSTEKRPLYHEHPHNTTTQKPRLMSGGGGMVSTARDYMRFAQMLLNRGELGGVRILKKETVEVSDMRLFRGGWMLEGGR